MSQVQQKYQHVEFQSRPGLGGGGDQHGDLNVGIQLHGGGEEVEVLDQLVDAS